MEITMEADVTELVPKLRFEGFTDIWKVKSVKKLLIYFRLGGNYENDEIKSERPLIKMGNMSRGHITLHKVYYVPEGVEVSEKDRIQYGDLFFNTRNTLELVGKVAIWRDELPVAYYNSNLMYLKFDDNFFMNYRLNSFEGIKALRRLATGTTSVAAIYTKDLLNLKVTIPSLPEQQKIASFLSAVDEKIQLLKRKKELLEQYKKGVMQQLFSGKLRFKDENGEDYPDWEEKFYGDIFQFYPTNSFSRDKLNYTSRSVRNLHYGDIHTKYNTLYDIENENTPYINEEIDLSRIKAECYCKEGDLIIADASEDYEDIGKSIEIVNLNGEKVLAGLHTFLARPEYKIMFTGFSGYMMQAAYVRKQIQVIAQGTKVLSISTGRLSKVRLRIPSLLEQEKIARFIQTVDVRILATYNQITHTQTFKKGLLQQMFV